MTMQQRVSLYQSGILGLEDGGVEAIIVLQRPTQRSAHKQQQGTWRCEGLAIYKVDDDSVILAAGQAWLGAREHKGVARIRNGRRHETATACWPGQRYKGTARVVAGG